MNCISCDKEYITARYEYLRDHMKGVSKLCIFEISSWAEPWGFGRQFKSEASKIYKEASEIIFGEAPDSISDDEYSGFIVTVLKTDTEMGIVWISEDTLCLYEHMEDLFNAEVINKKTPVNIPSVTSPKKPDNLVINRMHIFTRG